MIWADRVAIGLWAILAILTIVFAIWGLLDFYHLSILAELPNRKMVFSDVEVGMGRPTLVEYITVIVRIVLNAGILIALPAWITFRIVDWVFRGPARRTNKNSN
jgi:hypothetical protein